MRTLGVAAGAAVAVLVATTEVAELLPPGQLRTLRLFGVTNCLQLRRAGQHV